MRLCQRDVRNENRFVGSLQHAQRLRFFVAALATEYFCLDESVAVSVKLSFLFVEIVSRSINNNASTTLAMSHVTQSVGGNTQLAITNYLAPGRCFFLHAFILCRRCLGYRFFAVAVVFVVVMETQTCAHFCEGSTYFGTEYGEEVRGLSRER